MVNIRAGPNIAARDTARPSVKGQEWIGVAERQEIDRLDGPPSPVRQDENVGVILQQKSPVFRRRCSTTTESSSASIAPFVPPPIGQATPTPLSPLFIVLVLQSTSTDLQKGSRASAGAAFLRVDSSVYYVYAF